MVSLEPLLKIVARQMPSPTDETEMLQYGAFAVPDGEDGRIALELALEADRIAEERLPWITKSRPLSDMD